MPGTASALKGLRELLTIIKEGAKKDPVKVFLAEKVTGHRVPKLPEVKPPEGFTFGATDTTITRAPALVEKRKLQQELFSRTSPVSGSMRGQWMKQPKADSIRGLEELGDQTVKPGIVPKASPRVIQSGSNAQARARARAGLTDDQVRRIRSSTAPHSELAKEFGVSSQTVLAARKGDSYGWVK